MAFGSVNYDCCHYVQVVSVEETKKVLYILWKCRSISLMEISCIDGQDIISL